MENLDNIAREPQFELYKPVSRVQPLSKNHKTRRLLSLFSGCGGMDLGFEGGFVCHTNSINMLLEADLVERRVSDSWLKLKETRFETVFSNDILTEAQIAWTNNFRKYGKHAETFNRNSIVDIVKMHKLVGGMLPDDIDIVTGGFPCQDFSLAGKRAGFNSHKNHYGKIEVADIPTEETRGMLYYWMKEVIAITKPKIFVAENVKGLVNLENVKQIIENDFSSIDNDGYLVLPAKVLHAADYGIPQSRERVIFIGINRAKATPDAIKSLEQLGEKSPYYPYPEITHAYNHKEPHLKQPVCLLDVLGELDEPEETTDPSQAVYSKAKFLSKGQGQTEIKLSGIGPTIRAEHHGNIEFRRLSLEHKGKYQSELNEGKGERRLTPRECALIQTFPPDFVFVTPRSNDKLVPLSSSQAYKVIGNAVPPLLAYKIAMKIESLWSNLFQA